MMSAEDEKKSVYYDMVFAITVAVAFVAQLLPVTYLMKICKLSHNLK